MGLTGIEREDATYCDDSELQHSRKQGGAESGALGCPSCQNDARLAAIVEAWPGLSEEIRERLTGVLNASVAAEGV